MTNFFKPDCDRLYLMGDPHAYHKNICSGSTSWSSGADRVFIDQYEMTDQMVENINSEVSEDDTIICVGDWSFGGKDKIKTFRDRIACKNIALIFGNHDTNIRKNHYLKRLFSWTGFYNEFRYKKTLVCMMHYPLASWNESGRGSLMIHGHCHGNLNKDFCRGRIVDIGMDTRVSNLKPVKFTDLFNKMMEVPIFVSDHHCAFPGFRRSVQRNP